jgi:hypothetical protein
VDQQYTAERNPGNSERSTSGVAGHNTRAYRGSRTYTGIDGVRRWED